MNLNYDNLDVYTNGVAASTNFFPWQPLAFFTNAADRLLRAYTVQWRKADPTNYVATFYGVNPTDYNSLLAITNPLAYPAFGISSIPVWVSNRFVYSPAVNRLLQLAANMYDASTNNTPVMGKNYPSVFRPLFSRDADAFGVAGRGTNVFISGFTNVITVDLANPNDYQLALPIDIVNLANLNIAISFINQPTNVYGVPWIIGAKKGFPSFNELAMENSFQLTRKMQVTRTDPNATTDTYKYNQMYLLNLTNQLGVECWNSYTNAYANSYGSPVTIYANEYLENVVLTNDEGFGTNISFTTTGTLPVTPWPGYNSFQPSTSFQIPLNTTVIGITNSLYRFNVPGTPYLTTNLALPYETKVAIGTNNYPQPHWWLMLTNNLRVVMLEPVASGSSINRVIDYVQLRGPDSFRDLSAEIQTYNTGDLQGFNGLWVTDMSPSGYPAGIGNQVGISLGLYGTGSGNGLGSWDQTDPTLVENEIDGFRAFFHLGTLYNNASGAQTIGNDTTTNVLQAPYTPTATVVQHISWQANDPLIHYTGDDLNWAQASQLDHSFDNLTDENLGVLNARYMPWGGNPLAPNSDPYPYASSIKDPLIAQSDNWDFPTNKYPTIGWLGRVHRGTPWQTVYLKSFDVLNLIQPQGNQTNYVGENAWMGWTGNQNPFDATNAAPAQDRLMFDLFTTAFNDNATRGTLSVNVGPTNGNLAAWSALFSGMVVPTNLLGGYTIMNPAGIYNPALPLSQLPALVQIVNGINQTRTTFTNADGLAGIFEHVGDILAVTNLTEGSPFLAGLDPVTQVNDELYEWLPQQMMSLLRVGDSPRYVIYCYGQTLKPAPNGIYGSSPYFGLVTNYQVVAEIAARAVVRFNSTVTNIVVPLYDNSGTFLSNYVSQATVTNNNAVIESFNLLPPD